MGYYVTTTTTTTTTNPRNKLFQINNYIFKDITHLLFMSAHLHKKTKKDTSIQIWFILKH